MGYLYLYSKRNYMFLFQRECYVFLFLNYHPSAFNIGHTVCRLGKPDHRPNPRLWYYNTGLGGKDEVKRVNNQNWSLKTFPALLRQNNHTDVRTFVYA